MCYRFLIPMSTALPRDSEWLTRKRLIDPKLKAAGWRVVRFSDGKPLSAYDRCAIEEFPTDNGPADYGRSDSGKLLGIVEAKKLTLGPQNVLTQSERYAKGAASNPMSFRGYRVPFLYSTNGEIIWHHDIRHQLSRSHAISRFHTPEALAEKLESDFDGSCQCLIQTANEHPKLRVSFFPSFPNFTPAKEPRAVGPAKALAWSRQQRCHRPLCGAVERRR